MPRLTDFSFVATPFAPRSEAGAKTLDEQYDVSAALSEEELSVLREAPAGGVVRLLGLLSVILLAIGWGSWQAQSSSQRRAEADYLLVRLQAISDEIAVATPGEFIAAFDDLSLAVSDSDKGGLPRGYESHVAQARSAAVVAYAERAIGLLGDLDRLHYTEFPAIAANLRALMSEPGTAVLFDLSRQHQAASLVEEAAGRGALFLLGTAGAEDPDEIMRGARMASWLSRLTEGGLRREYETAASSLNKRAQEAYAEIQAGVTTAGAVTAQSPSLDAQRAEFALRAGNSLQAGSLIRRLSTDGAGHTTLVVEGALHASELATNIMSAGGLRSSLEELGFLLLVARGSDRILVFDIRTGEEAYSVPAAGR
jgi:hypothetical protein